MFMKHCGYAFYKSVLNYLVDTEWYIREAAIIICSFIMRLNMSAHTI